MDPDGTSFGQTGYTQGGVDHWLKSANKILKNRPKQAKKDAAQFATNLADGLDQAQQADCPLLVVVTPANAVAAITAAGAFFADKTPSSSSIRV